MKKKLILPLFCLLFSWGCSGTDPINPVTENKSPASTTSTTSSTTTTTIPFDPTLEVTFYYGENMTPTNYKNIYAGWIENADQSLIQNYIVCNRLTATPALAYTALPFWKLNKYTVSDKTEVDSVSSATVPNSDVTFTFKLKNPAVKKFKIFFEVDRSYDINAWFNDQPALLYSANVDLDSPVKEYQLTFTGWTPNEQNQNVIPDTPMGQLQSELRYITHLKNNSGFGDIDTRGAIKMVEKIVLTIK